MARVGSFRDALAFGAEGEHLVADALVRAGYAVTPFYLFERIKLIPSLLCDVRGIETACTLPDLLAFRDGRGTWVEVKRKQSWTTFDAARGPETGIDARAFDDYRRVAEISALPVVVVFVHEGQAAGLYAGRVDALERVARRWNGRAPNGARVSDPLCLFPRSALAPLLAGGARLALPLRSRAHDERR